MANFFLKKRKHSRLPVVISILRTNKNKMKKNNKYSFFFALIFIILCTILYFEALKIPQTRMVSDLYSAPIVWPKSLLILLFIFNFYTIIKYFREINFSDLFSKKKLLKHSQIKTLMGNKFLIILVLIGIYVFVVKYIGALLASFLLIMALLITLEEKNFIVIITYSFLLLFLIFFVFLEILYVPLPRGMGIFRIISLFFY